MAIWRKKNGKSIFMGIVQDEGALFKLDDPKDLSLGGTRHLMESVEFMTECQHYDDHTVMETPIRMLPLRNPRRRMEMKDRDSIFELGEIYGCQVHLFDLRSRPTYFEGSIYDGPHTTFPFGQRTPGVRAGDHVKVIASVGPHIERFWVYVVSVTSFGIITGVNDNDLHCCHIDPAEFIAFPVTAVLCMKKGDNWPKIFTRRAGR